MSNSFRFVVSIVFFLEILLYHLTSALFYHFSEGYNEFNGLGIDVHIALKIFQIVSISLAFLGLCGTSFLTRLILPLCKESFIGGNYQGTSIGEKSTAERKHSVFDDGNTLFFQISQSVFSTTIEVYSYTKSKESRVTGRFLSTLNGELFSAKGGVYHFGTMMKCDSNTEYGILQLIFDFRNNRIMGRYTSTSDSTTPTAYGISADIIPKK